MIFLTTWCAELPQPGIKPGPPALEAQSSPLDHQRSPRLSGFWKLLGCYQWEKGERVKMFSVLGNWVSGWVHLPTTYETKKEELDWRGWWSLLWLRVWQTKERLSMWNFSVRNWLCEDVELSHMSWLKNHYFKQQGLVGREGILCKIRKELKRCL